jgi:hypothetical protein
VVGAVIVGALFAVVQGVIAPPVIAHPGGQDARGCHNDRKNGGYHCHAGPLAGQSFGSSADAAKALAALKPTTPAAPAAAQPVAAVPSAPVASASVAPRGAAPNAAAADSSPLCGLGRLEFERMITTRLQTYGDSAKVSLAARNELVANTAARRATAALDGVYGTYSRFCAEGNGFMAGVAVGEWLGGLQAPTASSAGSPSVERAPEPAATVTGTQPLPVRIERLGEGWRITTLSTDRTWSQCEARSGQSRAFISSLEPRGAVVVTGADFTPRIASLSQGAQLTVLCRTGGATYTATGPQ